MRALFVSLQRNLNIIGPRSIHHFLIEHGHASVFVYLNRFDAGNHEALNAFGDFVEGQKTDVVGISLMSLDYHYARALTAFLKGRFPHLPVIWGGIHPTVAPEMCLDLADYVCLGEGEHVMLDVANAIDNKTSLRGIENLCYLENGELRKNPIRPIETNLDVFPVLRQIPPNSFIQSGVAVEPLTVEHLEKYKFFRGSIYRINMSRGCPMHCSYCVNSFLRTMYGSRSLRWRSVEHVMKELDLAITEGPKTNYVMFGDDCFLAADPAFLREFYVQYKKRIGLPFMARSTPHFITPDRMDTAVDAGLAFMGVGLQSGSERICREVFKRVFMPKDFLRAARLINQYPVAPSYDVIVDNPFETHEEDIATIETIAAIPKPFDFNAFSLTLYRGTDLRKQVERECPDKLDDPEARGYLARKDSSANRLKRIAATLHAPLMRLLLARYRRKPEGWLTQTAISLARSYCILVLEPITHFRLLRLSQKASTWKAFQALFAMMDFSRLASLTIMRRVKDTAEE